MQGELRIKEIEYRLLEHALMPINIVQGWMAWI